MQVGSRSFVQAVEQAAHLDCGPRRRPGITSDRCTQIDEEPEFGDVTLTSYAGLELFGRYLRTRRVNRLVRDAFADVPRWGDFGVVAMVRVLVGLVIVGGRRLRHLPPSRTTRSSSVGGVRVVPTARTMSRWLRHFTMRTVTCVQALNAAVVSHLLPGLGLRTWTIDVDGVVVSTGLQVERAVRGFNPHHRKVPSYDPIMAHQLPARDWRPGETPIPEAHRRAPAPERADAPLRVGSSRRLARPPRRGDTTADDR